MTTRRTSTTTQHPSGRSVLVAVLTTVLTTVALVLPLAGPASAADPGDARRNGPSGVQTLGGTDLVVGSGWEQFLFDDTGSTTVLEVSAPVDTWLRVTDLYCAGDEFQVSVDGVLLGATAPATAATCGSFTSSPTRAEVGDAWSSGGWVLPAGRHTVTVTTTRSPYGGGIAFVRADAPPIATARLRGASEVPGPGDPDGRGAASVLLLPGSGQVCFLLAVDRIGDVVAGHIHRGGPTVAGPVVVSLQLPPGPSRFFANCVPADPAVVRAIASAPWDHYLNVHTTALPGGAIRGQLQPPRRG